MKSENVGIDIWLGIDVGKTHHWATAVDSDGEIVYSAMTATVWVLADT